MLCSTDGQRYARDQRNADFTANGQAARAQGEEACSGRQAGEEAQGPVVVGHQIAFSIKLNRSAELQVRVRSFK